MSGQAQTGQAAFFSVVTPTFNRAHTLARAYRSLCDQSFQNFEWLVIDDGSTDGTAELVQTWQQQAAFPIHYQWQPNQHKKAAFNRGVQLARGQFVVVLDSDDALDANALYAMQQIWHDIPVPEQAGFAAITGLCERPDGSIVGDAFPTDVFDTTAIDLALRYGIRGEKFGCMRTDVLRRFPYPEDIQGFVPESLVWRAIARAGYKSRCVNQVLRVYHPTRQSLSNQAFSVAGQAPGLCLLACDTLANCLPWLRYSPLEFLKAGVRYTRFRLLMRSQGVPVPSQCRIRGVIPRLLVAVTWPVAWLTYRRNLKRL